MVAALMGRDVAVRRCQVAAAPRRPGAGMDGRCDPRADRFPLGAKRARYSPEFGTRRLTSESSCWLTAAAEPVPATTRPQLSKRAA